MSGYPNYSAPPGWQPPAYNPPPQGGGYRPQQPKGGGGGNGCMLAAIIVLVVVGIPTVLVCAGVGYFAYFVKTEIDKDVARQKQRVEQNQERVAKGLPPVPSFPFAEEKTIANAQDAIKGLQSNDWQRQKKGAEWLANNPVDASRKAAAAKALEKELGSFHREVADNCLKGLAEYGSKDNAQGVARAMKDHRVDRKLAIEQLGKWKDLGVAEMLAELLDDGGPEGEAAFKALEQIGAGASGPVAARLDPSHPRANGRAEKLLAGYGVDVQDALLTARLATIKSNDFFRKRDAIKALAAMPLKASRQGEVARALDRVIAENDRGNRDEAFVALLVWGDKESVPSVVTAVKSETFVNKNAVAFLGRHNDPRAIEALVALLDNNFADDGEMSKALAAYGAEGEKAVLKSLHDPRRRARDRARAILLSLDTKPDVLLTQTLADLSSPEEPRMRSAVEWLAQATIDDSRKKEVGAKLAEMTRNPNPFVQGPALEALVKLNDPASVNAIAELVRNPISQGRASMALSKAGAGAEDLLIALLEHADPNVNGFACFALMRTGTDKSVAPLQAVLRKAGAAKNQQLMVAARSALDNVQKRAGGK